MLNYLFQAPFFFFFFFRPRHAACRILVPRPGIKPMPPALGAQSLNHWAAREVPLKYFLKELIFRNSLAVQWVGLYAFTAVAHVQSLVGELRSCKLCGTAKNKNRTNFQIDNPFRFLSSGFHTVSNISAPPLNGKCQPAF